MLGEVEVRDDDIIGSLDLVGMFPNIPVRKTLEVVKEELQEDETLRNRTDWKPEDISKLLEISVETYFKTLDGKVYFQRNGLPVGKSISKPMAGIYMHWFEKTYVFNEGSKFKDKIVFWKRRMIFFSFGEEQKMNWSCLFGLLMELNTGCNLHWKLKWTVICPFWMSES